MTKIKIQTVTDKPADIMVSFQKTRKRNRLMKNWESMMDIATISEGRILVEKNFDLQKGLWTLFMKVVRKGTPIKIRGSDIIVWKDGEEIYQNRNPILKKQKIRFMV